MRSGLSVITVTTLLALSASVAEAENRYWGNQRPVYGSQQSTRGRQCPPRIVYIPQPQPQGGHRCVVGGWPGWCVN